MIGAIIGDVSGLNVGRNAFVVLLAVVALVFLSGNYALLFQFVFRKKRGSFVPPVGGIAGLLAMLLVSPLRRYGLFLLPLVLDPGTWALVCGFVDFRGKSRMEAMAAKSTTDATSLALECSFDDILVMLGSLLEIRELMYGKPVEDWIAATGLSRGENVRLRESLKRISGEKDESESTISITLSRSDWDTLLRTVRLVADRSNDVWDELGPRTGCSVEQFYAFAERLESALAGVDAETQPEVSK